MTNGFTIGKFDERITETLLVLIPKGDNPTTFKEFRPITQCNVIYKLISKVLVNRLRSFEYHCEPLAEHFYSG